MTKDAVYRLLKTNNPRNKDEEYKVVNRWDLRPVFFGTKQECTEWIERNAHDQSI